MAIIACGIMVYQALLAGDVKKEGISAMVIDMHTISRLIRIL